MSEDKQVKLSVYVNEDTRARFKATCAIRKVSMNQVVNQILEDWLAENDPMPRNGTPASGTAGAKGTRGKGRGKKGGEDD